MIHDKHVMLVLSVMLYFYILMVSFVSRHLSCVCFSLSDFQRSTSNCPTPNNCNNDYNPGDCQRIEQGVFEVNGRECPGCKICIREGMFIWSHIIKMIYVQLMLQSGYTQPERRIHQGANDRFIDTYFYFELCTAWVQNI